LAKEGNNSPPVAPTSVQKTAIKSNRYHKNRIEFRVPNDELWIYESLAKLLFESGHIRNPTVNDAARFSFSLYARDYVTEGELLTNKLSWVIPLTYYDKLIKELESEKQLRKLYERANKTFSSLSEAQSRTLDNSANCLRLEESHVHAIPDTSQGTTNVQSRDKTPKGRFFHIPGLMARKSASDYKGGFKHDQV
jgi:hypothetical protein